MAKFIARAKGERGETTRLGHRHIRASVATHEAEVTVRAYVEPSTGNTCYVVEARNLRTGIGTHIRSMTEEQLLREIEGKDKTNAET